MGSVDPNGATVYLGAKEGRVIPPDIEVGSITLRGNMRITWFRIENFRNLKMAKCTNPPDFMVICGGNGCGKSAILSALMTAKEHAGAYGNFDFDPRAVSADATGARIAMVLQFSEKEREFVKRQFSHDCPETDEVVIEINKGGGARATRRSRPTSQLLGWYSRSFLDSPGFFDYIDAHRPVPKTDLSTWDASFLSDERAKTSLSAKGTAKFANTKAYLAGLVMRDLQAIQKSRRAGNPEEPDSLEPIRAFFDRFFAPMKFVEVRIDTSPFEFVIQTPRGIIDLDDLSAGEKEVLNSFIRFHQLSPRGAIILFDEADAHLHPDLERRYLQELRAVCAGNQLWLTTHSPEMMIAAGSESLYTVLKQPPLNDGNQFVRVTSSEQLHSALSEVMGSRGLVSFNQRIIFIEGEESSADREVYEKLYPPGTYQVSFVPAGNSATVRKTAERVNELLSSAIEFQHYFAIVNGDIERSIPAPVPTDSTRLFHLPVYHVENFLLQDSLILAGAKALMATKCPYRSEAEVEAELKSIVLSSSHIKPYTKALLDARVAKVAKQAWDAVFRKQPAPTTTHEFAQTELDAEAVMRQAITDGTWRDKCKGREVLKSFCANNGLDYEHFRNLLIDKLTGPPPGLALIMNRILA